MSSDNMGVASGPPPHTPRDPGNLDDLRESMKAVGWLKHLPALLDKNGTVIVGNRRMLVAKELGIEPNVVVIPEFTDDDAGRTERVKYDIFSNLGAKPLTPDERKLAAEVLYTQEKWPQERIASALHVGQKTVSRDLSHLTKPPERGGAGMHKKETKRATPPRRGKLDAEQLEYTYGLLDQGVRGRKEIIQRIKNKFGFEVGEHVIQLAQARYDERKLVQAEQANGGNGNGHEPQADRKKPPTQSGKHLREMYDQRRAEGKSKVRELRIAIAKAAKEVEYFPMPESLEWDEEVQFMVEELYSDLERLRDWTDDALQVVMSHMDDISLQRKYRQAVELSNSGKTAGERMAGANAAERLRKRMNAERLNAPRQEN